jgi:hypothetical protein
MSPLFIEKKDEILKQYCIDKCRLHAGEDCDKTSICDPYLRLAKLLDELIAVVAEEIHNG